ITALSGGTAVKPADAVTVRIGAAAVGGIGLAASPSTLPSIGGPSPITAVINDTSGNALAGVPVTFSIDSTTAGSSGAGTFSATLVNTDGNGRATTQLTTNRSTVVIATAGVAIAGG